MPRQRRKKVAKVPNPLKPPKCSIRRPYIIKRGPHAGKIIAATTVCKKR